MSGDKLTVTQADRKNAAAYLRSIGYVSGREYDAILRGKWNAREEVQWFARTNTTTELVEALAKAADWFDDYARQHRAKLTQEGNLKADTNQERADYLRKALTLHDRALGK